MSHTTLPPGQPAGIMEVKLTQIVIVSEIMKSVDRRLPGMLSQVRFQKEFQMRPIQFSVILQL